MLRSSVVLLQTVAGELSFYEKLISAAKVILTGFAVVFGMLMLLIGIIKLYSFLVTTAQRAVDNRARRKERVMEPVNSENGVHIVTKPAYVTSPDIERDIPDEVVAVIAAAVAAYDSPDKPIRIKSIKKSSRGRSAWANAGVLDNTRPF